MNAGQRGCWSTRRLNPSPAGWIWTFSTTVGHGTFAHHYDPLVLVAALTGPQLGAAINRTVAQFAGRARQDRWHNPQLMNLILSRALAASGSRTPVAAEVDRAYAMVMAKKRLHQRAFRHLLIAYYPPACAVCGFEIVELLEAAHLISDAGVGKASLENGRLRCPNHHRADEAR